MKFIHKALNHKSPVISSVAKHAIFFLAMMMLMMSLLKLRYFKYCTIAIFNVRINILLFVLLPKG